MAKSERGKMERVAEGVYRRNGVYIVPIWNPSKGRAGGKDWHSLGGRCACGRTHEGSTLTAAKQLKRALESEKASSRMRNGSTTVDEWTGHYVVEDGREVWVSGRWLELLPRKAESTNINHDGRVRQFARDFAGRTLSSVTEEEAAGWAVDNAGSFKEVHSMFNDAVRMKLVDSNPFVGVRVESREGRQNIVVLTDAELEQLLALARVVHGAYGPRFAALIKTAAWTGMRPGELFLLSLELADHVNFVDLRAGVIHVDWQLGTKTGKVERPKNGAPREVVLLPGAEEALRSIRDTQQPGMPLFLTKQGKPFSQRTHFYYWDPVRKAFAAALSPGHHIRQRKTPSGDAGNLDFYELRHFFGTKLAQPPEGIRAATPLEIAVMMGHADNGQIALKHYVHPRSDVAQKSIRAAWRAAS